MSRILCTWELGGGAGHLNNLKVIGGALRSRGHEVIFALREVSPASRHFDLSETTLVQAPIWLGGRSRLPPSLSYPEVLNRNGYIDADNLTALLGGWQKLLRMVKPDLMIAEHSPTALIAARLEGVRRVTVGTGFETPPRGAPMPTIQPWRNPPPERLAESEAAVLGRINQALSNRGAAPLEAVSDIFDLDETFLCTLSEFDHYSERGEAEYWGPLSAPGAGGEIPWPAGGGDRIFIYYRVGYPHFAAMIGQIATLGLPTLVVADDASPAVIQKLSTEKLHIITTPVDLKAVTETAKVAVCHGGHGSVMNLVLGGCPLVMAPVWVEQELMTYRMYRAGVGVFVPMQRGKPADFAAPVRRILEMSEFAMRAWAIRLSHANLDSARQIERIADRCDAILSRV